MARVEPGAGRARPADGRSPARRRTLEASVLNYPDYMVFDLDPYIYAGTEKKGEEPALNRRAFEKTREMAFALKELLRAAAAVVVRQDDGQDGPAHLRAGPAAVHYDEIRAASATRRAVPGAAAPERPDDGVGRRRSAPARSSSTTTRTRAARRWRRSTRCGRRAGATSRRRSRGRSWRRCIRRTSTSTRCRRASTRIGDLWAGILDAKQDLKALLRSKPIGGRVAAVHGDCVPQGELLSSASGRATAKLEKRSGVDRHCNADSRSQTRSRAPSPLADGTS